MTVSQQFRVGYKLYPCWIYYGERLDKNYGEKTTEKTTEKSKERNLQQVAEKFKPTEIGGFKVGDRLSPG